MKITQVAIRPTEQSEKADRPSLTPELLAATGARYSRNNEGLEAILEKIDSNDLDKSVDSIFRMIDYGHASIADMAPVAMFIDGISLWLAYYIWSVCPTAGGQESSTRYIKMSKEGLIHPDALGIPIEHTTDWWAKMQKAFQAYQEALELWEGLVETEPWRVSIPKELTEDSSEQAQKKVARMRRNYAFDRARYFLPVAAATNVMLVMSARAWVTLCQHLLSHPLPEANTLGNAIREELALAAPRMVRHATGKKSYTIGLDYEFRLTRAQAIRESNRYLQIAGDVESHPCAAYLSTKPPLNTWEGTFAEELLPHDNRYAWIGPSLRRTIVRFYWSAVAFAEIRDLNRHRTGTKYCPLVPQGFYAAEDQLGEVYKKIQGTHQNLRRQGRQITSRARQMLQDGHKAYIYWTLLGTQYPFEHTTTADKFIYEAELRTGAGAHFRYAQHLRDVLEIWYYHYPDTAGLICEGSAEPE